MDYNDHRIDVSVRAVSGGWIPDVYVTYTKLGKSVLESVPVDQTFAAPNEAEQAGIEYAKKWIDGKPSRAR
jgi:phenolic acid decarboxylase